MAGWGMAWPPGTQRGQCAKKYESLLGGRATCSAGLTGQKASGKWAIGGVMPQRLGAGVGLAAGPECGVCGGAAENSGSGEVEVGGRVCVWEEGGGEDEAAGW